MTGPAIEFPWESPDDHPLDRACALLNETAEAGATEDGP